MMFPDFGVLLFATGSMIIIALTSHILRRILFPYIDLKVLIESAILNPIGAAIVVASVIYLLAVFVNATTIFLVN